MDLNLARSFQTNRRRIREELAASATGQRIDDLVTALLRADETDSGT